MNTNEPDEQSQKIHIALWQEDPNDAPGQSFSGLTETAGRLEGDIPIDDFISLRRAAVCKAFLKSSSSLSVLISVLGAFTFLTVLRPSVISTLVIFFGYIILSYQLIFKTLDTKDELLNEELRKYLTEQPGRKMLGADSGGDTIKVSVASHPALLSHSVTAE